MRPIGKKVLIKQDEAPVIVVQEPERKSVEGLITTPEEVRQALQEASKNKEIKYEYDGLEGVGSLLKDQPVQKAERPNSGIIVSVGDAVDLPGFKVGDHVRFLRGEYEKDENGEELLMVNQDALLVNLSVPY